MPILKFGLLESKKLQNIEAFEEFLAEEEAEMHHSGDEATLNMAGVKELADIYLDNNDDSTDSFKKVVDETLGL